MSLAGDGIQGTSTHLPSASSLAHSLQPRHVTMISLGGIIGAGIFVGSGAAIHIAGPAVIATYSMCGLLVFLIMRMLGEMAIARPGVGAFPDYAALGLGPWSRFTIGWLYFYFWVITIAVEALAGAKLLEPWIALPSWIVSTILLAAMTLTNLMSVKAYGEAEFWFASIKVASIIAFILAGLGYIFGFGPGLQDLGRQFAQNGGAIPNGVVAVFTAIPVVIFSMMGSEVATIAAVETANPEQNVVRAGRTVSLRILFFYVGSILVIVSIFPWNKIVPGDSPFTETLEVIGFPAAKLVMNFIVFTAVVSCLNSAVYVTSRMLFEMANRQEAPPVFAHTSSRRVPDIGIYASSVMGFAAILTSILSPNGIFVFLLQSSGAIILIVYLLITLSHIRLRKNIEATGERLKFRMWLFPWASYAVVGAIFAVLVAMAFTPDQTTQVALSAFSFLFTVAVYYFGGFRQRLRARERREEPVT
jgi:GABA permease